MTAINAAPGTPAFTDEVYARMGVVTPEQVLAQYPVLNEVTTRGYAFLNAADSEEDTLEHELAFNSFLDLAWVGYLYTKGELA